LSVSILSVRLSKYIMAEFELIEINPQQDAVLRQLGQFYFYDFSEIEGDWVDENGRFTEINTERFWTLPGARAFLCRVDGHWAGFAMISQRSFLVDVPQANVVEEFFVMRQYRRRGVGIGMANRLFDLVSGEWHLAQTPNNDKARKFWHQVVRQRTEEPVEEHQLDDDLWVGTLQRMWVKR